MDFRRAENGHLYAFGVNARSVFIHDFSTGERREFNVPADQLKEITENTQHPNLYLDKNQNPQLIFLSVTPRVLCVWLKRKINLSLCPWTRRRTRRG